MLKMSVREKIQSLIIHPSIYSVEVRDFRVCSSLESGVTIHVQPDVNRDAVLDHLYSVAGITTKAREPHAPAYGLQAFPYELIIEGAYPGYSIIFFKETQKEIAPASTEAVEKNIQVDYTTDDLNLEEPLRRVDANA
jgi:hypothetical protein